MGLAARRGPRQWESQALWGSGRGGVPLGKSHRCRRLEGTDEEVGQTGQEAQKEWCPQGWTWAEHACPPLQMLITASHSAVKCFRCDKRHREVTEPGQPLMGPRRPLGGDMSCPKHRTPQRPGRSGRQSKQKGRQSPNSSALVSTCVFPEFFMAAPTMAAQ